MSWTGMDPTIGRGMIGDRGHRTQVRWTKTNDARNPFRAFCTCGWMSRMRATREDAQHLGDEHIEQRRNAH